jgi:hypothetical protein
MDNDLFLLGVLVQRLDQVTSKRGGYTIKINSIPCVHVHLSRDKSH